MTAPRYLKSRGNATLVLARHRSAERMIPLLELDVAGGKRLQIELGAPELRALLGDALRLVSADPAEVRGWWQRLAAIDQPATPTAVTTGRR